MYLQCSGRNADAPPLGPENRRGTPERVAGSLPNARPLPGHCTRLRAEVPRAIAQVLPLTTVEFRAAAPLGRAASEVFAASTPGRERVNPSNGHRSQLLTPEEEAGRSLGKPAYRTGPSQKRD